MPKDTHDRTLVVHLARGTAPGQVTVRVAYRLEVDELTVFATDLKPYAEEMGAFQYRGKPLALYAELARRLGPNLATSLSATANGRELAFRCVEHKAWLHDEAGTPLGHVRLDFTFAADFDALPGRDNVLVFCDGSYRAEEGKLDLSLANDAGLAIRSAVVPDAALKQRPSLEREPGDDEKLRELRVVFRTATPQVALPLAALPVRPQAANPQAATHDDDHSLLRLLLHTDYGFWLTMLMALVFGAAHALTPGHGKTLVAAYLVGERGTVLHAAVLGVVTTLTHTGVVLLIAVILFALPDDARDAFSRILRDGLGLAMGLVVVCLGFWLLLQRLSGRADHVHIGGGHYHGNQEAGVRGQEPGHPPVRWWGLIVLGITGGLVPCWDAIYLLLYTVGRSEFAIALPAVLAFSAGLAGVLVLIGVLVVQVPHFARSRWGSGKVVRALPILSAIVVTLMGVWLCYEGAHGR